MGGNALKHLGVERKSLKEYLSIEKEVIHILNPLSKKIGTIPYLSDKESFGDLDILTVPHSLENFKDQLQKAFNPREIVHVGNSGVWNLDHKNLQIDIITTSLENFEVHKNYLSYNDINNLIGVLAKDLGFKHSHKGLLLDIFTLKTNKIGEITLSKEPKDIYTFLGYDYDRYQQGFKNKEEVFEFVVSSPFFRKEPYQEESMNHIHRVRDKKRPVYQEFREKVLSFSTTTPPDKDSFRNKALKHFQVEHLYKEILATEEKRIKTKEKFSGKIISKLLKIEGASEKAIRAIELKKFIATFKKEWKDEKTFQHWIENTTQEEINKKIINYFSMNISHNGIT